VFWRFRMFGWPDVVTRLSMSASAYVDKLASRGAVGVGALRQLSKRDGVAGLASYGLQLVLGSARVRCSLWLGNG
jgi:hypothetical protein